MQLRSDAVRCGTARAPHRSLLKADGITDEEMERPLVAVFNSRNDIIPGHNNLDKIAEAVKAGIYMAGGVPFEISTIGVCDGIANRHGSTSPCFHRSTARCSGQAQTDGSRSHDVHRGRKRFRGCPSPI